MLVVISNSTLISGEATLVNELFRLGLEVYHIRKYEASVEEIRALIEAVDEGYRDRLVLSHHHALGRELGLKRFHFSERDRRTWKSQGWSGMAVGVTYSTSVHSLEEFDELPVHFSYAFLSPVFDSISKTDYKAVTFDLSKRRNNQTKLIALGGISSKTISEVFQMGFDGAALLGSIWKADNPINEWNFCREELQLISGIDTRIEK